ncbi:hypothetical protein E4U43_002905 [Claviceps pusilla]|uniref:Uncharacterized protein n=1 Tax=Claviceps pusilla TaxID=123648 RepID=A0A9P7N808_9HYPO|nr:hypothetical protein E4U43_002905 [Claviceps pusilla]
MFHFQTPLHTSTRSIITAPTRDCEKCGVSWPEQKLFHCNKCRTTICLLCQCQLGSGFASHVQDCMALPHNDLIGPFSPATRSKKTKTGGKSGREGSREGSRKRSRKNSSKTSEPIVSPCRGLSSPQLRPFTKLKARTWLHGRPADDVFRLLIDSYRLHSYDKFQFEGENKLGSIFAGATDSSSDFDAYLTVAAATRTEKTEGTDTESTGEAEGLETTTCLLPSLLPTWWTRASHQECMQLGRRQDDKQFHDLHVPLSQAMTIDYYQDASFPTQLRIFAEQVMGQPVLMRGCTPLLEQLVLVEEEEISGDTAGFDWKHFNKAFAVQSWPGRSPAINWQWSVLGRPRG